MMVSESVNVLSTGRDQRLPACGGVMSPCSSSWTSLDDDSSPKLALTIEVLSMRHG